MKLPLEQSTIFDNIYNRFLFLSFFNRDGGRKLGRYENGYENRRRSNTADNKGAATRDNWISNLISGCYTLRVYQRKIHRDVFEIVSSSEKSVDSRFDSGEWRRWRR